jgi:hypothetical protein
VRSTGLWQLSQRRNNIRLTCCISWRGGSDAERDRRWLLRSEHRPLRKSKAGFTQVVLVFLAGAFFLVGLIAGIEPLVILNAPLEVTGLGFFIVRLWPELRPRAWNLDQTLFPRFAVLGSSRDWGLGIWNRRTNPQGDSTLRPLNYFSPSLLSA